MTELSYSWTRQPDGITCGPTCLSMARDAVARLHGLADGPGVPAIAAMCGSNVRTGTTHEGVAVAVRGLGLVARRVTGPEAFREAMAAALDRGDPVLLRTLTHGCKHWVLAAGRSGRGVRLLDPSGGDVVRSSAQVEALVSPRGHEIWPVDASVAPLDVAVGPLLPPGAGGHDRRAAIAAALALCAPEFEPLLGNAPLDAYLDGRVDWGLSQAVRVDGRIAGAYLLAERSLVEEAPAAHGTRHGVDGQVQGVALAVDPGLRGRGYGRLLRDRPRAMGYALAWGLQDRRLGNLDAWLGRRDLVGEVGDSWLTAEILPPPGHRPAPAPGAAWGP